MDYTGVMCGAQRLSTLTRDREAAVGGQAAPQAFAQVSPSTNSITR